MKYYTAQQQGKNSILFLNYDTPNEVVRSGVMLMKVIIMLYTFSFLTKVVVIFRYGVGLRNLKYGHAEKCINVLYKY